MIFQAEPWVIIVGLLVGTIVLFVALYVAEMYLISKTTAHDKKLVTLLVAFLGVFLVPILAGAIGLLFNIIGNGIASVQDLIPGIQPENYLMRLVPIFAFLIFWVICKFLIDTTWEKSGYVAIVGVIILFLIYTLFPMIPQTLPYTQMF